MSLPRHLTAAPPARCDGLVQAACLARCNGAATQLVRQSEVSLEDFTTSLRSSCTQADQHMIVSYTRKQFLQTGDGHFSPMGGYHSASNSALILDVARFKYCPHWVPVPMLYEAMAAVDSSTGLCRGYLLVGTRTQPSSVLFTVNLEASGSQKILSNLATLQIPEDKDRLRSSIIEHFDPLSVSFFIQSRTTSAECYGCGDCVQQRVVDQVLVELHQTELYKMVKAQVDQESEQQIDDPLLLEKITLLWLVAGMHDAKICKDEVASLFYLDEYRQILRAEVAYVKAQTQALPGLLLANQSKDKCCACKKDG